MNWDVDSIIKIAILLVVVFGGIIQFLYRTFFKPLMEAEARRRREMANGKPPQTLRDLLAEIRGEAQRAPAERPQEPLLGEGPPPPGAPHRDLVGEAAGEAPPREHAPPAAPAPLPGGPVDVERGVPGGGERVRPVSPQLRARAARRQKAAPPPEAAPLAESARTGPSVESRKLTSEIEERFKASAGLEAPPMRPLARNLPAGLTLREAIISQVILGRPRCRDRYAPPAGPHRRRHPARAKRQRP